KWTQRAATAGVLRPGRAARGRGRHSGAVPDAYRRTGRPFGGGGGIRGPPGVPGGSGGRRRTRAGSGFGRNVTWPVGFSATLLTGRKACAAESRHGRQSLVCQTR